MSKHLPGEHWLAKLAAEARKTEPPQGSTPSRLKSRIYSSLIRKQQESGPLLDVTKTKAAGSHLCVFEELVQITPVGERQKQFNCCSVCHARVLGERVEGAPIYWPHCPYVQFQNR